MTGYQAACPATLDPLGSIQGEAITIAGAFRAQPGNPCLRE
jgi:hypothetical protein